MTSAVTATLADEIAERAGQLQHNIREPETHVAILTEIRELRRRLNTLEQDLQEDPPARGDAC